FPFWIFRFAGHRSKASQVLSFQILAHYFARLEMPTPLFSSTPALFAQNTRGGRRGYSPSGGRCGPREAQHRGASQILSCRFRVPSFARALLYFLPSGRLSAWRTRSCVN